MSSRFSSIQFTHQKRFRQMKRYATTSNTGFRLFMVWVAIQLAFEAWSELLAFNGLSIDDFYAIPYGFFVIICICASVCGIFICIRQADFISIWLYALWFVLMACLIVFRGEIHEVGMRSKAEFFGEHPSFCPHKWISLDRPFVCYQYSVLSGFSQHDLIIFDRDNEMTLPLKEWPVEIRKLFNADGAVDECVFRRVARVTEGVYLALNKDC
ncbi:hypothetical protein ACQKRQ_21890 [Paraburkholderia sp. NPDC080076]|uniref:hypothetical protein n=1 Tax=Paraburkholderia sp. NPDC080076 TaxID=3390605 RepID=UPI003D0339D0